MVSSAILGIGSNLPEQILTNNDLEKMVDTNDQWIRDRTGIRERRIAPPGQTASELSVPACERALAEAGLSAKDIDLIILTTITPDTMCPSAACWLQAQIGADRAAAFDLSAACSGFMYGLQVSDAYIRSGLAKHILLVSVDIMSRVIDWSDRGSSVLWGDGAGAVVLGPATNGRRGIIYSKMYSDGNDGDMIVIVGGGSRKSPITAEDVMAKEHTLKLRGKETFKTAVRHFSDVCAEALEENGMTVSDVDVFVPHQANIRIIEAVAKRIGLSMDRVVVTIDRYGNMCAATIPVALDEWVREGKVHQGDNVLMAAFGGGLTWGAALVEW